MNAATKPRSARKIAEEAAGFGRTSDDRADTGGCGANGCPQRGSIALGGSGRFLCACHAMVPSEQWPAVTHAIRQHQWMLDIIRDVKAAGSRDLQWRKVAMLAWAVEPDMAPHAQETQALYVARLLQDFEHRVGARTTKPAPMVAQHTWATFQRQHQPAASIDGATAIGSVL